MINTNMSDAAHMVGGQLQGSDADFLGVSTDTRSLEAGQLFVALNGPNFRGVDFVPAAKSAGAAGALVEARCELNLPQIEVENSRLALAALASQWRARHALTVIGITGSNGKTTMRSLIAACMGDDVLATLGNLNNDIGVPLMLLRIGKQHRAAVIEMGANHAGEIAALTAMAAPQIAIVTNAAPAHLEGFGSLEGVAKAKGEIFEALGAGDSAIINADDAFAAQWVEQAAPAKIITFGAGVDCDVRYANVRIKSDGCVAFTLATSDKSAPVKLRLHGAHNAMNAAGAVAAAMAAGISFDECIERLTSVEPEPGRLLASVGINGAHIINDSYNANPASMEAAAALLHAMGGESWMVIGDMGELGEQAATLHAELGARLRAIGVDHLLGFGPLSAYATDAFGDGAEQFDDIDALAASLAPRLNKRSRVLVKGSRSMRMERVVSQLTQSNEAHQ